MDIELRLTTLSNLLDNQSAAVQERLGAELNRVEGILKEGTDYDELEDALKILTVLARKFHGAVLPALTNFARSVSTRELTQGGKPIDAERYRHRSATNLIRQAIDVPNTVRYVHIEQVVDFLLELSRFTAKDVRDKALAALQDFAQFNLHDFSTLGAGPQNAIVAQLTKLEDGQLVDNAVAVLRVLTAVLSPSMEGHTWTYNTLNIARDAIQSGGGVAEMRVSAIALLKRMYPLKDDVDYRKSVLSVLNSATRREQPPPDGDSVRMFERDALEVLDFMRGLVATEALPVLQKIEHDCYWDYVHAGSPDIETAALAVRDALAQRADYEVYKQLIGFEGIFGRWESLRDDEEEWDHSNTKRQEAARGYVESINPDNQKDWRDRILDFSKTSSDDLATFPVFYEFLELVAWQKPDLALDLLTNNEERMRPFLIPLVSGLWASERRADIERIVQRWLAEGKNLAAIAKSLFKGGVERLNTLSAVVARAAELNDRGAVSIAMGVAANLHAQGNPMAKEIFLQGLRALAQQNDARWARVFWFGKDFKVLIAGMDARERAEVLSSLASVPELDYQTEEMLRAIGELDINAVFTYLSERLSAEAKDRVQGRAAGRSVVDDKFEAIPYQLDVLNKLLEQHPEALLSLLRQSFEEQDARLMFPYRGGARLAKSVFPNFEPPFKSQLLKLVETGDESDIEFVLAIVRSYGGTSVILDVCKAIVKVVPELSSAWNDLAAAIETTGAVWGEYGIVKAFEQKRDELAVWIGDENVRVQAFAKWLTEDLERMIASEQRRVEEELALRKYRYGVGDVEA